MFFFVEGGKLVATWDVCVRHRSRQRAAGGERRRAAAGRRRGLRGVSRNQRPGGARVSLSCPLPPRRRRSLGAAGVAVQVGRGATRDRSPLAQSTRWPPRRAGRRSRDGNGRERGSSERVLSARSAQAGPRAAGPPNHLPTLPPP
jgi:hypothetical protein